MGRLAGICTICGRTGTDVNKCNVCGAIVCSNCFMLDIKICKRCLRKGLWVSDRAPE